MRSISSENIFPRSRILFPEQELQLEEILTLKTFEVSLVELDNAR